MIEWLKNLDPKVQAAIIGGCATIIGTLIAGIFSLVKKRKGTQSSTTIKQKQGICSKGSQIGVQNNYNNNTTIKFGESTADNGTIIIDCGNATGGGGITYESCTNENKPGDGKNEC